MDDELFSNECGSSNFNNFLNLLGDCVQLKVILLLISNIIVIIITMTISTIKFSTTITITSCCGKQNWQKKMQNPYHGVSRQIQLSAKKLATTVTGLAEVQGRLRCQRRHDWNPFCLHHPSSDYKQYVVVLVLMILVVCLQ